MRKLEAVLIAALLLLSCSDRQAETQGEPRPEARASAADRITYNNAHYRVEKKITNEKNTKYHVFLARNEDVRSSDYGDALLLVDRIAGNVLYKSSRLYDLRIREDKVLIEDLDRNGSYETVYDIDGDGEENTSRLYVIYFKDGKFDQTGIMDGYSFELTDLNDDGIMEIVHSYNEPYFSHPLDELPAVYKEDVYLFKDAKLKNVTDSCNYVKYFKGKLDYYQQILLKDKVEIGIPGIMRYYALVYTYRDEISSRVQKCSQLP